jgi:hypothetical protein
VVGSSGIIKSPSTAAGPARQTTRQNELPNIFRLRGCLFYCVAFCGCPASRCSLIGAADRVTRTDEQIHITTSAGARQNTICFHSLHTESLASANWRRILPRRCLPSEPAQARTDRETEAQTQEGCQVRLPCRAAKGTPSKAQHSRFYTSHTGSALDERKKGQDGR